MSIEAMKQALEVIEAAIKAGDWKVDGACDPDMAIHALRQAIEQAEKQEPVAWNSGVPPLYPEINDGETISVEYLETTPQPQREWVGLTQEDIDIAFDDTQEGGGFNEFARAIEQTLRRKNT